MSLFGDPHLGDLAAALVDGELDHDARDRAFAHLAHCADCRLEVDAQRRLKRRLTEVADPVVDDVLAQRLRSIASGDVVMAGRRGSHGRPATAPPRRPRRTRIPSARRRRGRFVVASGVTLFAVGIGAVLAGGQTDTGRLVNPPVDRFVVEHAATSGELPLNDPAAGAATVTFASVGAP